MKVTITKQFQEFIRFLNELGNYVTDEQIFMLCDIQRMQMLLPTFFAALCTNNCLEALKRFGSYKRLLGPLLNSVEEQGVILHHFQLRVHISTVKVWSSILESPYY